MAKLKLLDGSKPPPPVEVMATCPCGSRTFTPTTTGMVWRKGKLLTGTGTKGLQCARCGKPYQ